MAQPIIIGLVGPSGSGKTTVCEHLRKRYGFVRIHAATPLKTAFKAIFGLTSEYLERPLVEETAAVLGGVTPRRFLEHLGNAIHEVAPLALPGLLHKKLVGMARMNGRGGPPRIVVDGIRRGSEASVVRAHGGKILRLDGWTLDPEKPCDASQELVQQDHTLGRLDSPKAMLADLDWLIKTYFLPDQEEAGCRAKPKVA